jgi:hypothetical protein
MTIYDLLWKKPDSKSERVRWEKVGVLIDKDGKKSIKLDLMPVSKDWDGWFVVSERKGREDSAKDPLFNNELKPF